MKTSPTTGGGDRSLDPHSTIIERKHLGALFSALRKHGYTVIGPTVRDGAIVYDELNDDRDLPAGWTDVQDAGRYRLERRKDAACFGHVMGPHSWKRFLFPPRLRLWSARRHEHGFDVDDNDAPPPKMAFIGVRACELAAIAIQDTVFMGGKFQDPHYRRRRENVFVVAVNCTQAGATCFCVSMNTGPKVRAGYDLAVTEVIEEDRHYFVVTSGTAEGAAVLKDTTHRNATEPERVEALLREAQAVLQMGRRLDTHGLKDVLLAAQGHPHWDAVAGRCLGCANCTMVCPTCFCSSVEDHVDLTGENAQRWRRWDSCFNQEFSYIHGGAVRPSTSARYRQWITHKLANWHEQFGSSGCVGCGRCIAWCPAGIDITAEANALRGAITKRGK